jgi:acetyl-CoA carboxylase biotin carboxyl carrier protein
MKIDKKIIKELVDCLEEFNLSELEYAEDSKKIKVARGNKATFETKQGKEEKKGGNEDSSFSAITSPIVGTAYLAPEPNAKKFVEVGDKIKKGQTVVIIEAMKTMNHVPASQDGVVKKILVKNGEPVEFGQTLLLVK